MLIVNTQPSARGSPPEKGHWGLPPEKALLHYRSFFTKKGGAFCRLKGRRMTGRHPRLATTRTYPPGTCWFYVVVRLSGYIKYVTITPAFDPRSLRNNIFSEWESR